MARLKVLFVSDVHYRPDLAGENSMMAAGLAKLREIGQGEYPSPLPGGGGLGSGGGRAGATGAGVERYRRTH